MIPSKFGKNPASRRRGPLTLLLTTDARCTSHDGHTTITINHHELIAQVTIKPNVHSIPEACRMDLQLRWAIRAGL